MGNVTNILDIPKKEWFQSELLRKTKQNKKLKIKSESWRAQNIRIMSNQQATKALHFIQDSSQI